MVTQRDILIAAQLIISKYGDKAEEYASSQMQVFTDKGDFLGVEAWISIKCAIAKLLNIESEDNLH